MEYYKSRTHCKYYDLVHKWIDLYGDQESILDIGSADTPVATWGSFRNRYTIDPKVWNGQENVQMIQSEWPQASIYLPNKISVVTCLQVIEHICDVQNFVDAIFDVATYRVIISVPYRWRFGACKSHIHDPINKSKLRIWTKRKPIKSKIVVDVGHSRLIEEYAI